MKEKKFKQSFQEEIDFILNEDNVKGSADIELEKDILEDKEDMIKFLLLKELQSLGLSKHSIELYAKGIKEDPENFIYHTGHALFNEVIVRVVKNAIEKRKNIASS